MYSEEKERFALELKRFAEMMGSYISFKGKWTIRGFIDIHKHIYSISADTKVISKIVEIQLSPHLAQFASNIGYSLEPASKQNWYPDFTFVNKKNKEIKFAVDIKTTCRKSKKNCNRFTLGSHGKYFIDRVSRKNIQYPYEEYAGHFLLGIIYSRSVPDSTESTNIYSTSELMMITPAIKDFICFAEEKWKIASKKQGSGNTANIGSITRIDDILNGIGEFATEEAFDRYWMEFGEKAEKLKTEHQQKRT